MPIAKISVPEELKDLRPISILPVFSKILEKIVVNQMTNFLETNDILPELQSGFRPGYSCNTTLLFLLSVSNDIMKHVDNNLFVALVLIDYTKAFDMINHELLLSILYCIGFSKNTVTFFQNYLNDRTQCVCIGDDLSVPLVLKTGVPQGSVCGPILFLIYTSIFGSFLKHCKMHSYADDTQIYDPFRNTEVHEATQKINKDLNTLVNISEGHGLLLNPTKSFAMIFGKNEHAGIGRY